MNQYPTNHTEQTTGEIMDIDLSNGTNSTAAHQPQQPPQPATQLDHSVRELFYYEGATLFQVPALPLQAMHPQASVSRTHRAQVGGGTRGKITEYTKRSQRNLLMALARIRKDAFMRGIHIVLTYPDVYPAFDDCKRHLDNLLKRLKRKYGDAAGYSKFEFQDRQAPHFHLLVLGVGRINISWLSRAWFEVVGSGDKKHLRSGVTVERVRRCERFIYYFAKSFDGIISGRPWGRFGRVVRYEGEKRSISVGEQEVVDFCRTSDRARQKKQRNYRRDVGSASWRFRVYGSVWQICDTAQWLRLCTQATGSTSILLSVRHRGQGVTENRVQIGHPGSFAEWCRSCDS